MRMRNLVLAHAVAAAAALCPSAPWHAKFRAPRIIHAAGGDDDDLAALDAAAKAAQSSADAQNADAAAAPPLDDDPFWAAVADARIVENGGASYNRGRVVDAARADADAARARGVVGLTRAGELRWAQDADRVALFLPVAEDTKARSINVDVTPRALSLAEASGAAAIVSELMLTWGQASARACYMQGFSRAQTGCPFTSVCGQSGDCAVDGSECHALGAVLEPDCH